MNSQNQNSIDKDRFDFIHSFLDKELEVLKDQQFERSSSPYTKESIISESFKGQGQQFQQQQQGRFNQNGVNLRNQIRSRSMTPENSRSNQQEEAYERENQMNTSQNQLQNQNQQQMNYFFQNNQINSRNTNNSSQLETKRSKMQQELLELQQKIQVLENKLIKINSPSKERLNNGNLTQEISSTDEKFSGNLNNLKYSNHGHVNIEEIILSNQRNNAKLNEISLNNSMQQQNQQIKTKSISLQNGTLNQLNQVQNSKDSETPLKRKYIGSPKNQKQQNGRYEKEVTFENQENQNLQKASSQKKLNKKQFSPEVIRKNKFILEKAIEDAENKLDISKVSIIKKQNLINQAANSGSDKKKQNLFNNNFSSRSRCQSRDSSDGNSKNQTLNNNNQQPQIVQNNSSNAEIARLNRKILRLKKENQQQTIIIQEQKNKTENLLSEVQKLQKKIKKISIQQEKLYNVDLDYKKLMESFEKSEFIRNQQKLLIQNLKFEIDTLKNKNSLSQSRRSSKEKRKKSIKKKEF